ncbi:hypothetical protein TH61_16250 [Rufibacter sp. DG15C]|uniref:hypothetical protein n=1 Tax=Rufibacter sp. DG15C TaxID=1379909 RepID=UPI00078BC7B8|nr:hypothetical protein [Rufibacter sp. DG15C]AMM52428.1 hypothetical protein TH61_16250 [Rufibacter sp. DG15C]
MESLTTEQEIQQQLTEELSKLKKAVAYIEEAKEAACSSSKLLEEMNEKVVEMLETKSNFRELIVNYNERFKRQVEDNKKLISELERKILEKTNTKLLEEKTTNMQSNLERLDSSFKAEVLKLVESNGIFRFMSMLSFVLAIIALIISVLK